MYTEKVMDHFEHPRNVGEIENPSGMGTVGNPKCGDIMRIYLDIDGRGSADPAVPPVPLGHWTPPMCFWLSGCPMRLPTAPSVLP